MKKKFVMSLRKKVKDKLVRHHIQQIGSGHREIREIGRKRLEYLILRAQTVGS